MVENFIVFLFPYVSFSSEHKTTCHMTGTQHLLRGKLDIYIESE